MAKIKMSKAQGGKTFSKDSTSLANATRDLNSKSLKRNAKGEKTANKINEKYSNSRIGDMGPAGREFVMNRVKDYVDNERPKLVGYKDGNKDYGPKDKKGNYRFAPMEDYKKGGKIKKVVKAVKAVKSAKKAIAPMMKKLKK
jgi:hypothetical protein